MATNNNQKLAVLIDADNAQATVIQELLAEVSRYGTATIKRAYGDWTTTNLKSWKEVLHTMAIQRNPFACAAQVCRGLKGSFS